MDIDSDESSNDELDDEAASDDGTKARSETATAKKTQKTAAFYWKLVTASTVQEMAREKNRQRSETQAVLWILSKTVNLFQNWHNPTCKQQETPKSGEIVYVNKIHQWHGGS